MLLWPVSEVDASDPGCHSWSPWRGKDERIAEILLLLNAHSASHKSWGWNWRGKYREKGELGGRGSTKLIEENISSMGSIMKKYRDSQKRFLFKKSEIIIRRQLNIAWYFPTRSSTSTSKLKCSSHVRKCRPGRREESKRTLIIICAGQ